MSVQWIICSREWQFTIAALSGVPNTIERCDHLGRAALEFQTFFIPMAIINFTRPPSRTWT